MACETETTVLGGLPVTIEYEVSADEPDVGYRGGVDEWWITAINGRPVKKCDWLDRRIAATKGETDRILEELNELANDYGYDDYYD